MSTDEPDFSRFEGPARPGPRIVYDLDDPETTDEQRAKVKAYLEERYGARVQVELDHLRDPSTKMADYFLMPTQDLRAASQRHQEARDARLRAGRRRALLDALVTSLLLILGLFCFPVFPVWLSLSVGWDSNAVIAGLVSGASAAVCFYGAWDTWRHRGEI